MVPLFLLSNSIHSWDSSLRDQLPILSCKRRHALFIIVGMRSEFMSFHGIGMIGLLTEKKTTSLSAEEPFETLVTPPYVVSVRI